MLYSEKNVSDSVIKWSLNQPVAIRRYFKQNTYDCLIVYIVGQDRYMRYPLNVLMM